MDETHKGFWEYLQSMPEPAKKRVLVIATAVIMAFVIYFWLAYFNNLITGVTQQPAAPVAINLPAENVPAGSMAEEPVASSTASTTLPVQPVAPAQSEAPSPGMWQRFTGGMGFVYGQFVNLARGIEGMFASPGQYRIKPHQSQ